MQFDLGVPMSIIFPTNTYNKAVGLAEFLSKHTLNPISKTFFKIVFDLCNSINYKQKVQKVVKRYATLRVMSNIYQKCANQ